VGGVPIPPGMPADGMSTEYGLDVKPGENTFNISLPYKYTPD